MSEVAKAEGPHALLMRELLQVIERTRIGCGKGPAQTLETLDLSPMAALCELAEHVAKRDRQQFEAGWRAGIEAERMRCVKITHSVKKTCSIPPHTADGSGHVIAVIRRDILSAPMLTPPAAQPAEEVKP